MGTGQLLGVTCDGIAVDILLAASCYRNRDELSAAMSQSAPMHRLTYLDDVRLDSGCRGLEMDKIRFTLTLPPSTFECVTGNYHLMHFCFLFICRESIT